MGVSITRAALLFGVFLGATDFWKSSFGFGECNSIVSFLGSDLSIYGCRQEATPNLISFWHRMLSGTLGGPRRPRGPTY